MTYNIMATSFRASRTGAEVKRLTSSLSNLKIWNPEKVNYTLSCQKACIMTDWDLLTPGIGLSSLGIVTVGISLSGIAKTFIEGMHAVGLLTLFIGMIFLASGLFKDGFPSSGRAKSATFITLGFLVTFGFAAAITVSTQAPSIFIYIGLMLIIAIPSAVLAVASYKRTPYIKALAVIFIIAAVIGGSSFYVFGLVTPKVDSSTSDERNETLAVGNETNINSIAVAESVRALVLSFQLRS